MLEKLKLKILKTKNDREERNLNKKINAIKEKALRQINVLTNRFTKREKNREKELLNLLMYFIDEKIPVYILTKSHAEKYWGKLEHYKVMEYKDEKKTYTDIYFRHPLISAAYTSFESVNEYGVTEYYIRYVNDVINPLKETFTLDMKKVERENTSNKERYL